MEYSCSYSINNVKFSKGDEIIYTKHHNPIVHRIEHIDDRGIAWIKESCYPRTTGCLVDLKTENYTHAPQKWEVDKKYARKESFTTKIFLTITAVDQSGNALATVQGGIANGMIALLVSERINYQEVDPNK